MEKENKTLKFTDLPAADMVKSLEAQKPDKDCAEYLKQYYPDGHKVNDKTLRPDKQVTTDTGIRLVPAARIPVTFQKIIVQRAAAFLIGEGIRLVLEGEDEMHTAVFNEVVKIWNDSKMDYRTRNVARTLFRETEVAELWYITERIENGQSRLKFRMKILSNQNGDTLYPHFNEFGDMNAFGRKYSVGGIVHFDIYTADFKINLVLQGGDWIEIDRLPNQLKKIPIVYYSQDEPEWSDVQVLIERFETLLSNFADSNDYFGSPLIKVRGEVKGFAAKGEQGKMIELEENADANYLTWDQAPEAIKLEKETLQELIYSLTQTPDISFKQMKGIGNISGIALRLMFVDAELKSQLHQESFSEGVQRRINIILAAIGVLHSNLEQASSSTKISPEFTFYLPQNEAETIETLVRALGGGKAILSRKTALQHNPYVKNVETELQNIIEDEQGDFGTVFPDE